MYDNCSKKIYGFVQRKFLWLARFIVVVSRIGWVFFFVCLFPNKINEFVDERTFRFANFLCFVNI